MKESYIEKTAWAWFLILLIIAVTATLVLTTRQPAGFSLQDISLKNLMCGSSGGWWDNIPIINFFSCTGRLNAVAGVIGIIIFIMVVINIPLLPELMAAVPWLWLVPIILGYLVGSAIAGIVLDYWYMIIALVVILSVMSATKAKGVSNGEMGRSV